MWTPLFRQGSQIFLRGEVKCNTQKLSGFRGEPTNEPVKPSPIAPALARWSENDDPPGRAWADWCGNLEGLEQKQGVAMGIHSTDGRRHFENTSFKKKLQPTFLLAMTILELKFSRCFQSVLVDTVLRSPFVFPFLVSRSCILVFGYTVHSRFDKFREVVLNDRCVKPTISR